LVIRVLLFARPRELAGTGAVNLELPDGATAADAFEALSRQTPALAGMRAKIRCAVDGAYAGWETRLGDGCEVALIPPTAGG
jgi:molybdopterin converting factor subunit 1